MKEGEEREDQGGVNRHSGDEHVVRPDEEAENGDGYARQGDELEAEDAFAREAGDEFTDDAHRRQDHDVHGRMGIEPEQVLEEQRVAAQLRIENAEVEDAFEDSNTKVMAMTGVPGP